MVAPGESGNFSLIIPKMAVHVTGSIMAGMSAEIGIGDRVRIRLDSTSWGRQGWFEGTVVRIEPYSAHRSFYWVELDDLSQAVLGGGIKLISVFNPKNIEKLG
jgi:hypothetical protein